MSAKIKQVYVRNVLLEMNMHLNVSQTIKGCRNWACIAIIIFGFIKVTIHRSKTWRTGLNILEI